MRILTLCFFLSIFLTAKSQDTTKVFYADGNLRSLQIKADSNLIFEKSFYKSGKVEGEIYAYKTNGKPLIKSLKTYFETGEIKDVRNDTLQTRYEPDGSLFQTSQYKNFKKNGATKTYLAKKLWLEMEFKDDVQDGWTTTYNTTTGKPSKKEFYVNGKQDGPIKFFDSMGRLLKVIYYSENCPYKAEYYDLKGKLTDKITDKKSIWLREGQPLNCN